MTSIMWRLCNVYNIINSTFSVTVVSIVDIYIVKSTRLIITYTRPIYTQPNPYFKSQDIIPSSRLGYYGWIYVYAIPAFFYCHDKTCAAVLTYCMLAGRRGAYSKVGNNNINVKKLLWVLTANAKLKKNKMYLTVDVPKPISMRFYAAVNQKKKRNKQKYLLTTIIRRDARERNTGDDRLLSHKKGIQIL